jgi:hypothetical protein
MEDGARPGAGDPGAVNADVQQRVDDVLASIPGGHQVSATEIDYDGLTVTVDPNYSANQSAVAPANISCGVGHFCIVVSGTAFDFFTCTTWDLSNWFGSSPFNNNQTGHVTARAWNQDFSQVVFSNTAPSSGTVDVTPWWHFRPC